MNNNAQMSYLDGKITIEKLTSKADAIGRFRAGDERGEVAMIVSGTAIQYVEFAAFVCPNVKRGFHFHEKYLERLYVISGALCVKACLVDDPDKNITTTLSSGDIITIEPRVAHAFVSLKPSQVLSMGTGSNPFDDRKPYGEFFFAAIAVEEDTKSTK